jgi:hypothetical protein
MIFERKKPIKMEKKQKALVQENGKRIFKSKIRF